MPKKRRGARSFASARAKAGSIASSRGRPSRTPAPRRKWRRERGRAVWTWTVFIFLFIPEKLAFDDAVYQRFYPITIGAGAIEYGFYFRPVAKSDRSAGGVDHQLTDEVA